MTSQKDIHGAIRRRDVITIRKMAQLERKEEPRIFLSLLADFVERDLKKVKKERPLE